QDIGMRVLERIRDELADVSVVEHMPKLEGRQMIMVLAPKRKYERKTTEQMRPGPARSPQATAGLQDGGTSRRRLQQHTKKEEKSCPR
ncbi:MAG: hypothetical protein ACXWCU_11005, partial [Caldimonas sp.]